MLKLFRSTFGHFGPSLMLQQAADRGGGRDNGPSLEQLASAYLGRNQGPEFFASTPHTGVAGQIQIPRPLSLNRPLEAIILRWRGRVVIGVANYTAVAAEAPYTIIDRIQVQGTFKGTQLTPIFLSGATTFSYMRLFRPYGNTALFGTTRQADPTSPFQQLGANFGNIGTYDLDIFYVIPVAPIVATANRARGNVSFLWQPQDWNNLQITLNLGDLTSFGTPGGATTVVFTAFGSGAGTPIVEIHTRYEVLGALRAGFRTACVVRNESVVTAGLGAVSNNVRLLPLSKQKTSNVLVKTGIALTGTTSGVNVFATLSDTILDVTQIQVDNRPIRNSLSNLVSKQSIAQRFGSIHPQGYLLQSFVDSMNARSAYRADLPSVVGPQSSFDLVTNVLAAAANQQANIIQEMIFADADDPYWAGTR